MRGRETFPTPMSGAGPREGEGPALFHSGGTT